MSKVREMISEEPGLDDVIMLDPEGLDAAVIGISNDYRAVYSYEKLVQAYMDTEGWTYEEAVEWIDYNTLRAIPYMDGRGPIIVMDEHMFNGEV